MPRPRMGADGRRLSVRLSVPCLTISRACNGVGSLKLATCVRRSPLRKMWRIFRLSNLTFRPLNGVTGYPCHGLHSRQFSAYQAIPFST